MKTLIKPSKETLKEKYNRLKFPHWKKKFVEENPDYDRLKWLQKIDNILQERSTDSELEKRLSKFFDKYSK